MRRGTVIAVLTLLALAGAVAVGALALMQRDRAALASRFAGERLAQVSEAAEITRTDLESVGVALNFAAHLAQDPGPGIGVERELTALLAAGDQYRQIAIFGPDGARTAQAVHPRLGVPRGPSDACLSETARQALSRAPGDLEMSEAHVFEGGARARCFATALGLGAEPRGAVAVLVDTERLFAKIRVLTADPALKVLLLGPHGKPTSASDAHLAQAVRAEPGEAGGPFGDLIVRMRAHERGTRWLDEAEAARLGLGDSAVVAAFVPVAIFGRPQWALATLSSTAVLRSAERALVQRLSTAAGAIAVLLAAFGAYLVLSARREGIARERLARAEGLAQLHEKTEKILENIPTGVITLAGDLTVTAVNRAIRERVPAVFMGKPLREVLPEAPVSVVARLTALLDQALASGEVASLASARLALFGEEGQYRIHAVPLGPRFAEARLLLVIEDVSDVKALESQLLRSEKLATIGVLTAGLAHEVGTPLGVVRGRAEYIKARLGADHGQAEGMGVIITQIDRVTRIIRQLLDFSRVKPAAVRSVRLDDCFAAIADLLKLEASRRAITFRCQLDEGVPDVAADPDQLQQTLLNLALNACDATAPGGHVTVRGERAEGGSDGWGMVRIVVADDGCGIEAANRQAVFDPFFTTKKRGKGTGLGLTVVAQIVRNHGGHIELDSEPGRGTTMTVLWPAAQRELASGPHA